MTVAPVLTIGSPPIEVTIRRTARARRLTLRIGHRGPVLTLPNRATDRDALAFLSRQEAWLRRRLAATPDRVPVQVGARIDFAGQPVTIAQCRDTSTPFVLDGRLVVPQSRRPVANQVREFLIAEARRDLAASVDDYASRIGRRPGRITLRDTRSRWGSCTAAGNLMFSWRLIMAPAEVLDYVAAHEVAHLREMHHGPEFWDLVADICPNYDGFRQWLRQNGPLLHRFEFDS